LPATVTWEIDTHRSECLPYVLREVARQLRLDGPEAARDALMTWDRDRLIRHLSQFTQAELRPPAMRPRGA
jgi:hypothetical protein